MTAYLAALFRETAGVPPSITVQPARRAISTVWSSEALSATTMFATPSWPTKGLRARASHGPSFHVGMMTVQRKVLSQWAARLTASLTLPDAVPWVAPPTFEKSAQSRGDEPPARRRSRFVRMLKPVDSVRLLGDTRTLLSLPQSKLMHCLIHSLLKALHVGDRYLEGHVNDFGFSSCWLRQRFTDPR